MDFLEIKKLLKQNADSENAAWMSAYMRNQFPFFGIPGPKMQAILKPFLNAAKKSPSVDWGFVDRCFSADERDFQNIAIKYLQVKSDLLTKSDMPRIKKIIQTKPWWDTGDCMHWIVGELAMRDKPVRALMLEWSRDEDFWIRRQAICHQRFYKDKTDTVQLAKIIKDNFGSREFFINKAIGWALREYSKTDPAWVRKFIDENRPRMAPLSIREASKYI